MAMHRLHLRRRRRLPMRRNRAWRRRHFAELVVLGDEAPWIDLPCGDLPPGSLQSQERPGMTVYRIRIQVPMIVPTHCAMLVG